VLDNFEHLLEAARSLQICQQRSRRTLVTVEPRCGSGQAPSGGSFTADTDDPTTSPGGSAVRRQSAGRFF
jgi:hypothetical protein